MNKGSIFGMAVTVGCLYLLDKWQEDEKRIRKGWEEAIQHANDVFGEYVKNEKDPVTELKEKLDKNREELFEVLRNGRNNESSMDTCTENGSGTGGEDDT